MRNMQQNVQGTPAATYENARSRQAARLRHVRPKIRTEIAIDRPPAYALGTEAVQVFGVLAGVRTFDRIEVAHEKAHGGKAVQVRRM